MDSFVMKRTLKIISILKQVEKYNIKEIKDFKFSDKHYIDYKDMVSQNKEVTNFIDFSTGQTWGEYDQSGWFKAQLPFVDTNGKMAIEVTTFENGWDALNPQFLLYINGQVKQGFDTNHWEYELSENFGELVEVDLHAYSGGNQNIELKDFASTTYMNKPTLKIKTYNINDNVRNLIFDLSSIYFVIESLEENSYERIQLIHKLNKLLEIPYLSELGTDKFNESIVNSLDYANKEIIGTGHLPVVASVVGHTHIDIAWLWTVKQSREKAIRSFSTVISLMEKYPNYIFMSSQPILYKFIKEDYPEVYEKIKQLVKIGRWEVEGGMWVEPDTNVPSGESLIRQLLIGKKFIRDEFGIESKILWLPDVFGYSAALPQILKKSGIEYFMTTKIAWNQYNKFPYDTFNWVGLDGSAIFTHMITTTDPYQNKKSHQTTYNGNLHPNAVVGAWDRYQQKAINNDVLISYGHGDGGGGPTYEMLEYGKRLEKGISGAPKVRNVTSLKFFEELRDRVDDKDLSSWNGELYLEYHRGTYTSAANNKKFNRKAEQQLNMLEKISSINLINNFADYNQDLINENLEIVLTNQFHDILPGSSIKEVYEKTDEEYAEILGVWGKEYAEQMHALTKNIKVKGNSLLVFNHHSFEVSSVIEFASDLDIQYLKFNDECYEVFKTKKGYVVQIDNLPALGYKLFEIEECVVSTNKTDLIFDRVFENDFIKVEFNSNLEISSLINKTNNIDLVKENETFNKILMHEDVPMEWDAWDIDKYYQNKFESLNNADEIKILDNNDIYIKLATTKIYNNSTIKEIITLYHNEPKIDFAYDVDWKEKRTLMRTYFPSVLNSTKATFDVQFGNIERNTHQNTSWDEARFEVCAHKWIDVSEGNAGFSLINESKYGCAVDKGTASITLLKSGISPYIELDNHKHSFSYTLFIHNGCWQKANITKLAAIYNAAPTTKILSANDGTLGNEWSLLKLNSNNLVIETIKKCENNDDLIIRLYDELNSHGENELVFNFDVKEVYLTDLMENNTKNLDIVNNTIKINNKPFEIITLRVKN